PGVSLAELNLELKQAQARLLSNMTPKQKAAFTRQGFVLDARSMHAVEMKLSPVGDLPWLLQAVAGLLLLLALANTINLGLVRQRARQRNFALRRVFGASHGRLVRMI